VLRDSFSTMAKEGECIATAIVFAVVVDMPTARSKSNAMRVCLECSDGCSFEVFFPYRVADGGQVVYGPIFSQEGKREVFSRG
jgi:hypothetical protein